jgi:hypothetical protein
LFGVVPAHVDRADERHPLDRHREATLPTGRSERSLSTGDDAPGTWEWPVM